MPDKALNDDPLSFSDEESFGLFLEGLRSLQQYEDAASTEHPLEAELERTMQSALRSLRECASRYPNDLLPTFYLGVALSMKNQEVYVDRLVELKAEIVSFGRHLAFADAAKALLNPPPHGESAAERADRFEKLGFVQKRSLEEKTLAQPFLDLGQRPWPLLEAASRLFDRLTNNPANPAPPELQRVARYNLAQVLARRGSRDEPKYIDDAIAAIPSESLGAPAKLDAEAKQAEEEYRQYRDAGVNFVKRLWPPMQHKRERQLQKLLRRIRSIYEMKALFYQYRALLMTLQLRKAVLSPSATLVEMVEKVKSAEKEMEETTLFDPSFKADLFADYWSKSGYARYEFAYNDHLLDVVAADRDLARALDVPDHVVPNAGFFIDQAATHLTLALELKEYWNPAQIYLALVRRIQTGMAEAGSDFARHKKESALAQEITTQAHLAHEIKVVSDQESEATDIREKHRLAATKLGHLDKLSKTTSEIERKSAIFDREIAIHDRTSKRFAAESEQLFNALQGFPSEPAAASVPDSSATTKPAAA